MKSTKRDSEMKVTTKAKTLKTFERITRKVLKYLLKY